MVICLDLSEKLRAAKSPRQLQSVAFCPWLHAWLALYQMHLCSTLDVLGNHPNFAESRPGVCYFFRNMAAFAQLYHSLAGSR